MKKNLFFFLELQHLNLKHKSNDFIIIIGTDTTAEYILKEETGFK